MEKIRVYIINNTDLSHLEIKGLNDKEFAAEAEREGLVYTLQNFQTAVNYGDLNLDDCYIRFIKIDRSEIDSIFRMDI